jgi:hypothetical protein
MARILILDLMLHSICSWLNRIWMRDSSISIWDMDDNEKARICIGMYIDPLVVPIYEPCGMHSGFN